MSGSLSPLQKKALRLQEAEVYRKAEKAHKKAEKRAFKEGTRVAESLGITSKDGQRAFVEGRTDSRPFSHAIV